MALRVPDPHQPFSPPRDVSGGLLPSIPTGTSDVGAPVALTEPPQGNRPKAPDAPPAADDTRPAPPKARGAPAKNTANADKRERFLLDMNQCRMDLEGTPDGKVPAELSDQAESLIGRAERMMTGKNTTDERLRHAYNALRSVFVRISGTDNSF